MAPVRVENALPEMASASVGSPRFGDLRGVRWRIDLGIFPSSPSASIDDLRRVTANSRRRYATLRKQLLVDPHVTKDGSSSPNLVMDNPLSQNPDSMWSRFFRNAELEGMVDQDLTRLYPERGGYFQTSGCQIMLRRILLLWCLQHPEYGYRQGMHELLAPLLYVLHVDVERLSEVRKIYEDHFADKFDGFYHENDLMYKFDFKKFTEYVRDRSECENGSAKVSSLAELDPATQTIVLLSDAYGAEGELGVVLSEKFMEHDVYVMFDALMSGAGGVVSMAEFFSPSPYRSSHMGFPTVIEASATIYHLLSVVNTSLHTHLVELGVEPQYFSLRWLRVLFGREFSLEDLLLIWDEIFACDNMRSMKTADCKAESNFRVLDSPRGAFISAFAVSMMLQLRSPLLASDNATACLQKLLNFPEDVDIGKMVTKAKLLQALALKVNRSSSSLLYPGSHDGRTPMFSRCRSLGPSSPRTPLNVVPESYWEEKWRVLHEEEEHKRQKGLVQESETGQEVLHEKVPSTKKGWSERVKLRISRTVSDFAPSTKNSKNKIPKSSAKRNLLDDLSQQLGSDEHDNGTTHGNVENRGSLEVNQEDVSNKKFDNNENAMRDDVENQGPLEVNQDVADNKFSNVSRAAGSGENFANLSGPPSPIDGNSDRVNESEKSSVASNSSIYENDAESCETHMACPLPVSDIPDGDSPHSNQNNDSAKQSAAVIKERSRSLSGKLQWLWKFGRNSGEGTSDRPKAYDDVKGCNSESDANNAAGLAIADDSSSKGETIDQNLIVSLRNLGQSMLENIQVIESVFQQDPENSKDDLVGKGQVTVVSALRELRKISNILSEM